MFPPRRCITIATSFHSELGRRKEISLRGKEERMSTSDNKTLIRVRSGAFEVSRGKKDSMNSIVCLTLKPAKYVIVTMYILAVLSTCSSFAKVSV